MTKNFFVTTLLILMLLISACSNNNKSSSYIEGNQWLSNTINYIDSAFVEYDFFGGFKQSNFNHNETHFDLLNTTMFIEALIHLEENMYIENKVEYQEELKEVLVKYKSENTNISLVYVYWCLLKIYSASNIEIPVELINEIEEYIKNNVNSDGFAMQKDNGLSDIELTLLYCKIKTLLGDIHFINKPSIESKLEKAINEKNDKQIINLYNIANSSHTLMEVTHKKIFDYFSDNVNIERYYKEINNTLSDAAFYKLFLDNIGVSFAISQVEVSKYIHSFNKQINNNQGINGADLYNLVVVVDNEEFKEKAKKYIIESASANGWWGNTRIKVPTLQDTNISIKTINLLGSNINEYQKEKIINLYELKNNSDLNINEYPSLIGIKTYFELNGVKLSEIDLERFMSLFKEQTLETQSRIFADIFIELSYYKSDKHQYTRLLKDLENYIILNSSSDVKTYISKFNLMSITGILIAQHINQKIDEESVIEVIEHYKRQDGYTINPYSNQGDIIGNYLVVHLYELLEEKVPKSLKESANLYRRNKSGYSFLSTDHNTFNIYSTYLGFVTELKVLEETKNK